MGRLEEKARHVQGRQSSRAEDWNSCGIKEDRSLIQKFERPVLVPAKAGKVAWRLQFPTWLKIHGGSM